MTGRPDRGLSTRAAQARAAGSGVEARAAGSGVEARAAGSGLAESTWAPVPSGRASFASSWAQAVAGTSYVPLELAEVEAYLRGLTDRLSEALFAEPFSAAPGHQVGEALVNAH